MLKVPVINKSNNNLPKYATSGSAGFDFCANVDEVKEKLEKLKIEFNNFKTE